MTHPLINYLQGEKVYLRPLEPHDVDKMYVSVNNYLELLTDRHATRVHAPADRGLHRRSRRG